MGDFQSNFSCRKLFITVHTNHTILACDNRETCQNNRKDESCLNKNNDKFIDK